MEDGGCRLHINIRKAASPPTRPPAGPASEATASPSPSLLTSGEWTSGAAGSERSVMAGTESSDPPIFGLYRRLV